MIASGPGRDLAEPNQANALSKSLKDAIQDHLVAIGLLYTSKTSQATVNSDNQHLDDQLGSMTKQL